MEYAVLMSVYEKENPDFLRQSIESILRQTILPGQFILVKDGPLPDELEEVIKHYGKRMEKEPGLEFTLVSLKENKGLGPALNAGLKAAKFDCIARMDSDDISVPERCEWQLQAMREQEADIVSGTILEFGEDIHHVQAVKRLPKMQDEILKYAKRRNPFNHPCVMFKKHIIEKAGMYREVLWFEDYDLWVRALMQGARGYNMKEPLLYMRAGENMYLRRGGIRYVRQGVIFRWKLWKMGFSGSMDFFVSVCGQVLFGIVPNKLRRGFYKYVLRR